jgi:hypothetical protein
MFRRITALVPQGPAKAQYVLLISFSKRYEVLVRDRRAFSNLMAQRRICLTPLCGMTSARLPTYAARFGQRLCLRQRLHQASRGFVVRLPLQFELHMQLSQRVCECFAGGRVTSQVCRWKSVDSKMRAKIRKFASLKRRIVL